MTNAQRIAELESLFAEATADNAIFLETLLMSCVQDGLLRRCIFCGSTKTNAKSEQDCIHNSYCVLAAEHPGSRLLEERERDKKRLEAAEKVVESLSCWRYLITNRKTNEALAAWDEVKEPKP